MAQEYRNIYQKAREVAGFTQERAAELIDISVESIRAYETDRRIPPNETVAKMVEIYNAHYLAYIHLKNSNPLAKELLPDVEIRSVSQAVLYVQKELNDALKQLDALVEIGCDNKVSKEERERFDEIMKELHDVVDAVASLDFATENSNNSNE